jgi:hypothetical protein
MTLVGIENGDRLAAAIASLAFVFSFVAVVDWPAATRLDYFPTASGFRHSPSASGRGVVGAPQRRRRRIRCSGVAGHAATTCARVQTVCSGG